MEYTVSNVYFPWEKWSDPIGRPVSMVSIHPPTHPHTHTLTPPPTPHTHSLLAGKVLLGITLLGKSCHYRSSPPPRSHSSNDLIGQSSSHMTTQGSFIPPTQSSISDIGPLGQKSSEQVLGKKTVHLCSKCQPKPLAQVERFTLCSNRII